MTATPAQVSAGMTLITYAVEYREALAPVLAGEFNPDDPDQVVALDAHLDHLDEMGILLRDKAQRVAGAARQLRMWAADLARDRAEMEAREAKYLKQAEHVERYLQDCMEAADVDRFEGGRFTIRIQVNPPKCEVLEEMLVPASFLRHIPEKVIPEKWEVNKTAINEAFKRGESVPGTVVTRSKKLVIGS